MSTSTVKHIRLAFSTEIISLLHPNSYMCTLCELKTGADPIYDVEWLRSKTARVLLTCLHLCSSIGGLQPAWTCQW